jgi:hypothetical protein
MNKEELCKLIQDNAEYSAGSWRVRKTYHVASDMSESLATAIEAALEEDKRVNGGGE